MAAGAGDGRGESVTRMVTIRRDDVIRIDAAGVAPEVLESLVDNWRKAFPGNPLITTPGVKRCTKCQQDKPLDGFAACAPRADGRTSECRVCRNASTSAYRRAHGRAPRRITEKERERMTFSSKECERRAQAETSDQARNHGKEWTGPELDLAARNDLTAKQVALLLGRTLKAVRVQRHLIRVDPRKLALTDAGEKWAG